MATVLTANKVALEVTLEEMETIREGLEALRVVGALPMARKARNLLNDMEPNNWKPVND